MTTRPDHNASRDIEAWFSGADPEEIAFDTLTINDHRQEQDQEQSHQSNRFSRYTSEYVRGWRQPKFQPTQAYDKALAKERMLAPAIGGRSKKAQLGSVEESWGSPAPPLPSQLALAEGEEERKGMFELVQDPPSRNVSPFKEDDEELLIKKKKEEFLTNARRGTNYERMKDPSDFFEGQSSVDTFTEIETKRGKRTPNPPNRYHDQHALEHSSRSQLDDEKADHREHFDREAKSKYRAHHYHALEYDHSRSQSPHVYQDHQDLLSPSTQTLLHRHVSSLENEPQTRNVRIDIDTQLETSYGHSQNCGDPWYDTDRHPPSTQTSIAQPSSSPNIVSPYRTETTQQDDRPQQHYNQSADYKAWLARSKNGTKPRKR
ncbi:uncharacterized protein IL334_001497 [Kwoniella shivajii]|uniref:Uncharacterized protein n=1 Tax=Kwoniella shivajii TaxID=564305 RepID=A0ABZ1CTN0_9TREE|nr:hypothetical protein IL334_001497 [Kwoniella shivajii]